MGEAGSEPFAVLGGGPAGLTAGYVLARDERAVVVFEAEHQVGGLARTVVRDGYRFDLGGHRFFTKSAEVQALWEQVLGDELLVRDRLSRIFWRGRFIDYPLRLADVRALLADRLEGRGSGTPGNDTAAVYAARRFRALGLDSLGLSDWIADLNASLAASGRSDTWMGQLAANSGWRLLMIFGAAPVRSTSSSPRRRS